jgi:pimeloyl-ACP methyl ester carboxylesterase
MQLDDFNQHRTTVATRSGTAAYADFGRGATPTLFIHGVGTGACLWRHVIECLPPDHRSIALDLPLHGRSPVSPDQDLSLGGLARFVTDVCDALDLEQVDVVGNDTGGAIAQVFAVNNVDRVRTLTLTNCDTHDNLPPDAFKPTVELAASGQLAAIAPQLLADMDAARASGIGTGFEHPDRISDEVLHAFFDPVLGTFERARQFERLLTSLDAADLLAIEPRLRSFHKPTLVVWGTGDPFFETRWAHWLRDTIPGVTEVILLDGARLFFPEERPSVLAEHLERHLDRAEAVA